MYLVIVGCVAVVEALAILIFTLLWSDEKGMVKIYKEESRVVYEELKALRLKKADVDFEVAQNAKEIATLRIEVDASVEQLTKEQSAHRLQEDQIQRIREIIQGDPIGTENSESEQQERNTHATRINHS